MIRVACSGLHDRPGGRRDEGAPMSNGVMIGGTRVKALHENLLQHQLVSNTSSQEVKQN
jgi:hypothetical protein